jgi:hypothetical protein
MISFPTYLGNPDYFRLLPIWNNQQHQDAQNQLAHDAYQTAAEDWLIKNQSKLAYNQPLLPPLTPPKHVQYNDDGTQTLTDFPDLKPTVMPPAGVPSGPVVDPAPPMDRLDAVLMIVTQILNRMPK